MLKEALSAASVLEEQGRCADERLAQLASRLRERPPTLALTVARGSSDHAASYFAYLVMQRLGVPVVSLPMSLVTLHKAGASGADAASMVTTGRSLVALHDWTFLFGPGVMPAINALLIGMVMYRTGLIPRLIPTIGLIGAPLLLASGFATLFGAWAQVSGPATLFALPIAAWEFSFGVWMAFKGFKPSAVDELPAVTTTPSARIPVAA